MEFIRIVLVISLLYCSDAVSLEDVAASLQAAEDMLKAMEDNQGAVNESDINDLKTELKEHVDEQIKSHVKTKTCHERMYLQGFIAEKKMRKQLEAKTVALQTELDVLKEAVTHNRVQFSDLKNNAEQISTRVDDVRRHVGSAVDTCTANVQKVKEAFKRSRKNANSRLEDTVTNLEKTLKASLDASRNDFFGLTEKMSRRIDALTKSFYELKDSKNDQYVYFRAKGVAQVNLRKQQKIVFSTVTDNSYNVYDKHSGVFTAPVNGLYFFSVQFCTKAGEPNETKHFYFAFVVDGRLQQTSNFFEYYSCHTTTLLTRVSKGSRIWLESTWDQEIKFISNEWLSSVFSGFLVK